MINPYKILNIPENASLEEIKKARNKMAAIHHPDKGGCIQKMAMVNDAYDQLINLLSFPNPDTTIMYNISIKDIFFGKKETITVKLQDGSIRNLNINLPIGVDFNKNLIYKEQGISKNLSKVGNIIIKLNIIENNRFVIRNNDLLTSIVIDALDAITGCVVEFMNANDEIIKLSIHPGVQPNEVIVFKKMGLPSIDHGSGNLMVQVNISIPSVSNEIKKVIETIKNT